MPHQMVDDAIFFDEKHITFKKRNWNPLNLEKAADANILKKKKKYAKQDSKTGDQ
jgi:hypothetical protein